MSFFDRRVVAFLFAAAFAVGSAFSTGAFAQDNGAASVSFKVNVNATVRAVFVSNESGDGKIVQKSVTANQITALTLQPTGVLNGAQRRIGASAIVKYHAGKVSLNLPAQSYKNAEVSLYTVNGRRILRNKVSASSEANKISRRNLVAGVYLLSVKGADGGVGAVTSRLTHRGGNLDINVTFGNGGGSSAPRLAKSAAASGWMITVWAEAEEYTDTTYVLNTAESTPQQNITLRLAEGGGSVVGDWLMYSVLMYSLDDLGYGESYYKSSTEWDEEKIVVTFKASGDGVWTTFTKIEDFWVGSSDNGQWRVEGSTLYTSDGGDDEETIMQYRISGNKLIVTRCEVDSDEERSFCMEYTTGKVNLADIRNDLGTVYVLDPALYGVWILQGGGENIFFYDYGYGYGYFEGVGSKRYIDAELDDGYWFTNDNKLILIDDEDHTKNIELTYSVTGYGDDRTLTIDGDIWKIDEEDYSYSSAKSRQGKNPTPKGKSKKAFAPLFKSLGKR